MVPVESKDSGEPRWAFLLAFGIAAFVAGYVVLHATLSRYGVEAFIGAQGFSADVERSIEDVERSIETEVLGPGRPPGYPAFLALTAAIWGAESHAGVTIVLQALTAWATMLALFLVARRATGSAAWSLLAVALVSLNELWVVESIRQRETFLYSAILLALVGVTVYARHKAPWYAGAVGALCAIGWLTRLNGVVLFPAVLVLFWKDWRGSGPRVGAREVLALTLSFGLPILGWAAYQKTHFGWVRISGNDSAKNFSKGNNHAMTGIYPFIDVDRLSPVLLEPLAKATAERGGDVQREYVRHAIQFVSESPVEALALVPRKLAAFFVPIYFPLGSGTARLSASGDWQVDDYQPRPIGSGDGIMALPGIFAFFLALTRWRTLTSSGLLIVLVVGFTAIVHIVTWAETRYRLPYDTVLALLCVQIASSALRATISPKRERVG